MEENNKVSVKIYGQEYTIAGNSSREHIMKVADYVNTKMHEIAKALPAGSISSLAVLSAVNVADDYFTALGMINGFKSQNEQLEKDSKHYVQLWDEAKRASSSIRRIHKPALNKRRSFRNYSMKRRSSLTKSPQLTSSWKKRMKL